MYLLHQPRHRQDLTTCVQAIRRDQAAQRRNLAYLVIFVLLLVAALEMLAFFVYVAPSLTALINVLCLLVAALTAGVLLAWPK
ncbi:MAG TPA: hypothetical protein PKH77_00480 [Anaerolineae bacterium]|nr:hypothetical protein [Anaerolineae bacterium]